MQKHNNVEMTKLTEVLTKSLKNTKKTLADVQSRQGRKVDEIHAWMERQDKKARGETQRQEALEKRLDDMQGQLTADTEHLRAMMQKLLDTVAVAEK